MLSIPSFSSIVFLVLCTRFDLSLASYSNTNAQNAFSVDIDTLIQESINDLSSKMTKFEKNDRRYQRPFVTLSYAQSIDGKIALVRDDETSSSKKATSSNFAISGPESLRMTHALRSIHDAILVGGKTLSVDNPRLTNRLWPETDGKKSCLPVVLDTNLDHVRLLGGTMRAKNPIVCCSVEAYERVGGNSDGGSFTTSITLLPCKTRIVTGEDEGKKVLDLRDALSKLHSEHGIGSIMVEGGASVLSLFVGESSIVNENDKDDGDEAHIPLFDCLCVTISPKLLGANGLDSMSSFGGIVGNDTTGTTLGPLKCISLGDDCVLFADCRG